MGMPEYMILGIIVGGIVVVIVVYRLIRSKK